MTRHLRFTRTIAHCALFLALGLLTTTAAHAQYVVTGTTAGGGNVVTGSGTALGNLFSGDGTLSSTGFDNLTFEPGSIASGTIGFTTPGNTVLNLGTVVGPYDTDTFTFTGTGSQTLINKGSILGGDSPVLGSAGGTGVLFYNGSGPISEITVKNQGTIQGGMGGDSISYSTAGTGGDAVYVYANNDITNVSVTNSGNIIGGAGGNAPGADYGGYGGNGVTAYSDDGELSNFSLKNSGMIAGGDSGSSIYESYNGGHGVYLYSYYNMTGISLMNSGTIKGGNSGMVSGYYADTSGNGGAAIYIQPVSGTLSNFTLNNSGLIQGGNSGDVDSGTYTYDYQYSGEGGEGVYLYGGYDLNNVSILNTGTITGGHSGDNSGYYAYESYSGAPGVSAIADDGTLNNFSLTNQGTITGGNSGNITGSYAYQSYGGGAGVYIDADEAINNLSINNSGFIGGGTSGNVTGDYEYLYSGSAGSGIFIETDDLSNSSITNSGTIRGGKSGDISGYDAYYSYGGGSGIVIYTDYINNLTINNSGLIQGGMTGSGSGNGGYYIDDSLYGGDGVYIYNYYGLSNVTVTNSGTIEGGAGGSMSGSNSYEVEGGGYGLEFRDYYGTINNVNVFNNGLIRGGDTGTAIGNYYNYYPGAGGVGLEIYSGQSLTNIGIFNTGRILGGDGHETVGGGLYSIYGGYGGDGVYLYSGTFGMSNVNLVNTGTIRGGDGGPASGGPYTDYGGNGGSGLDIIQQYYLGSANTVTNFGVIAGGNGATSDQVGRAGSAGYGVYLDGNGFTFNNWGSIASGNSGNGLSPSIYISGTNNTINLNGHSSLKGMIEATGANNVVNIDFTGMSPAAQAALKAQLEAQGSLSNFSGSFTARGVTYTVDPVIIKLNLSSYQTQGLTPTQQSIGAALDSIPTNPAVGSSLFNLFNAIDTSGNVPAALNQLSPQMYAALGDIAISQANFAVQSIDARLNNIRNGSESVDTTGIGGSTSGITSGLSKNDGKSSKEIQPAAPPTPDRWGFFATGDGLFFRGSHNDVGLQDAKANSAGSLVGVDGKVGENGVIGALFAYNSTSAEMNGSAGHADIESYTGGLYGSWHEGGYYVNGLAAYTRNNYDLDRNIVLPAFFGDAKSSPDGDQVTANIDGGYDWNATDRLAVGPMAGVQYVHLNIDGFTESGAGAANLNVNSQDISSLQTRLGLHANYHLASSQTSSFALDFHAAWQHEYLNDSRALGAGFAGIPTVPFGVQTAAPQRDAGIVGLGVNFTFKNRLTLFTEYELEMWSSSYFSQSVNGGARISF